MNTLPSLILFGLFLWCTGCQSAAPAEPARQTLILHLQHTEATAVAESLAAWCGDTAAPSAFEIRADEATNSILVQGAEKRVEQVRALVEHLDVPGA